MKEKIKNFFTNKVIAILSIFAILITCVCSSAFAYDIGVSKDITYKIPDDLSSHAFKWIYSGVYRYNDSGCTAYTFIFTSDSPISIELGEKTNTNDMVRQNITLHSDSEIYFVWNSVNTSYKKDYLNAPYFSDFTNSEIYEYSKKSSFVRYYCDAEKTSYGYSNFDVKNIDGNVVFQRAPQAVEQVKIPAIQQAKEIPQAMTEVLKILIPIGLVIFGIGLVIFLIRYCRLRLM